VVRRRVLVSGEVQGVFYRDTCRHVAQRFGVAGWVRNLPDGRVEAVFEGTPDDVALLIGWSRRGPSLARVSGVDVQEEPEQGETGFAVR
jgi:acylphosphatase